MHIPDIIVKDSSVCVTMNVSLLRLHIPNYFFVICFYFSFELTLIMLTNSLLGIVLENWIQCVSIFRVKQKKKS